MPPTVTTRRGPLALALAIGTLLGAPAAALAQEDDDPAREAIPAGAVPMEAMGLDPTVSLVVPAPDGERLFLLREEAGRGARVQVWSPEARTVTGEVKLPRAPAHMAIVHDVLVVACAESGVVAFVDVASAKVVRAVEVECRGTPVRPVRVHPDSPSGTALVSCEGVDAQRFYGSSALLEVPMVEGAPSVLLIDECDRAAVAGGVLAVQRCKGWSPAGVPQVYSLADLRVAASTPTADPATERGAAFRLQRRPYPHEDLSPLVAAGKVLVGTEESGTVRARAALDPEVKSAWSCPGMLLARHPLSPVGIVVAPERSAATRSLSLSGVDLASGAVVFRRAISFGGPLNMRIAERADFNGDPTSFAFPLDQVTDGVSNVALSRAVIVPGAGGRPDRIALRLSRYRGEVISEYATMLHEIERTRVWVWAPLPSRAPTGGADEPPTSVRAGETVRYRPALPKEDAVMYALREAPEGMTIDRATGAIEWVTGPASVGTHDVVVVARRADGVEERVLDLTIRVRGK